MANKTLIVTVLEAKNLLAADKGGTSDPYCKLRIGSSSTFKTKIIKKCLAPKWNETFTFKVADPKTATLIIEVLDHDTFSSDDPLGSVSIPLSKLEKGVETATWHNLTGVPKGQVYIKLKAVDFGLEPGQGGVVGGSVPNAGGGPQGYPSMANTPPMGGMPGQPQMGGPPMGGGYPPNPYASNVPMGGPPPMGGGGYPPNPYGPPQPGPNMYPPNPYSSGMPGGGYPPDPYSSGMPGGGGYPPNPYGAPQPGGFPGAYPPGPGMGGAPPGAYSSMGAPPPNGQPPQNGGYPPQPGAYPPA